jgi:uncharacterized protein YndB with AHSA1/START domain
MMKVVLVGLVGLILLVALAALVFYVAGARMKATHRSVVMAEIPASRAVVWKAITDYTAIPGWWPAVKSVRFEKQADGTEITWNRNPHGREVPFRTLESRMNEKLVRVIARDDLPFGGTWTFDLVDAPDGRTRLTLTEDGIIRPPILRAIAQWFYGLDTTQRDFLAHLETHLGGPRLKP